MRNVSSTGVEGDELDRARSATWIVTSTVRSSSLASIMRTGPLPDQASSISVWPGEPDPRYRQRLLVDQGR